MSAKMATPGLLNIKVFSIRGYELIISLHEVTNKILSHDNVVISQILVMLEFL